VVAAYLGADQATINRSGSVLTKALAALRDTVPATAEEPA
jgi:hypothetical protein